jgi:hypothetical protein
MKPPRSALPLPRYVRRLPLKGGGWSYWFDVHNIYIKAGCPLQREGLGTDYAKAVERAETVLLPMFDEWRTGREVATSGASVAVNTSQIAAYGTLDWVFAEYRPIDALPSWAPEQGATMRSAFGWLAVTSSRTAAG